MANTDNNKFNLTAAQLCDIIDDAFELGKTYATDELESCRPMCTRHVPVYKNANEWNAFIELNGGYTFHSGDAKADILFKHLHDIIRDRFSRTVAFD